MSLVAPLGSVTLAIAVFGVLPEAVFVASLVSNVTSNVAPFGNSPNCPPSLTCTKVRLSSSDNCSFCKKLINGRATKLYPTLKNPKLSSSLLFPEVSDA